MRKTERLTIKVLPDQKAALESLAQREGEPVAVVLRRLIRTEAQRRGLLVEADSEKNARESDGALAPH